MNEQQWVIWVSGQASQRQTAAPILAHLRGRARPVTLGHDGHPAPDLRLPEDCDLGRALDSCPPGLWPHACLWVAANGLVPPADLEGLPCPVLGWGDDASEGRLPDDPQEAAQTLL